jgi:uncharacterized protein YciI
MKKIKQYLIVLILIFLMISSAWAGSVDTDNPTIDVTMRGTISDGDGQWWNVGFEYGLNDSMMEDTGLLTDPLGLHQQSASYGATIHALAVDDEYVYAGGVTTRTIRQYWKSNMTMKAESASYGATIYALAVDDEYVYAGGATTRTVRQYWKSNMTYKAQSANYGGTINALAVDDEYVYAGGVTTRTIRQYQKSDLGYVQQSASYGGDIRALAFDDEYVYAGGATTRTVWKCFRHYLAIHTHDTFSSVVPITPLDILFYRSYMTRERVHSPENFIPVSNQWVSVENALVANGLYASGSSYHNTQYALFTDFNIPPVNATGITVVFYGKSDGDPWGEMRVRLSWDGGGTYTSTKTFQLSETTDTYKYVGGSTDVWGATWDNFDNFSVHFRWSDGSWPGNKFYADAVSVIITSTFYGNMTQYPLGTGECPPCNSTNLTMHQNIVNATGWHNSTYDNATGWTVWANYTGNATECPSTVLMLFNNSVNTTGNITTSYDSVSGWKVWVNLSGMGSIIERVTGTSGIIYAVMTLFFIGAFYIFMKKRKKRD